MDVTGNRSEDRSPLLYALGGEAGCRRLSADFYARVAQDSTLRPLFPGKSLRCATEEFAAFLIQFLGGDESQSQYRWQLSLRESHARFRIGPAERSAWLRHMTETLQDAESIDAQTRQALRRFFLQSSAYIIGKESPDPAVAHEELASRWDEQRALDDMIAAIATAGEQDGRVIAAAPGFASRPSVFIGLLARMAQSGRDRLVRFAVESVNRDPSLIERRSAGRSLLHFAAGAGCLDLVNALLRHGADPNLQDHGGHAPLYRAANECASESGPGVVFALVRAGARVDACDGVTRATALHMAARRGFAGIAQALLDCGAPIHARDRNGVTPLQRALNCRRHEVAKLLSEIRPRPESREKS
jgi:hemoglobin